MDKYGSGQESFEQYTELSAGTLTSKVTVLCWLLILAALVIIAIKVFVYYDKMPPSFKKCCRSVKVGWQREEPASGPKRAAKMCCSGSLLVFVIIFMVYLCAVSYEQSQIQAQTFCDIARFSDTVKYGVPGDDSEWAGTQNLSTSIEALKLDTG